MLLQDLWLLPIHLREDLFHIATSGHEAKQFLNHVLAERDRGTRRCNNESHKCSLANLSSTPEVVDKPWNEIATFHGESERKRLGKGKSNTRK